MKNRLLLLIALAFTLANGPTWGQGEMKIVIEPEHPDLNDLITVTITNTKCAVFAEVQETRSGNFKIRLTIYDWECLDPGPDAADFETTIGPLEVGDYWVTFSQVLGLGARIADTRSFSVGLPEGGINGLYYNPESDGHYFIVLDTNYTTMVVWMTFDADGNQVWVYGLGELIDGRRVMAETYINRSSGLLPGGKLEEFEYETWGWIELDMTSCRNGTVTYQSDLPGFGSGQFSIVRLAYVKQLGCGDTD